MHPVGVFVLGEWVSPMTDLFSSKKDIGKILHRKGFKCNLFLLELF